MNKESLKSYFSEGLKNCFPITPTDYKNLVIKPELYSKYCVGAISSSELTELRTYFDY